MAASVPAISGDTEEDTASFQNLSPAMAPSPGVKEWAPRLQLVVDIDHTLVHSVVGIHSNPRLQWLSGNASSSNQGEYYRLKCGMKTSLRPDTISFLCQASKHYDISLCTLGTRGYATEVAQLLSQLGAPAVQAIHSRETLALALRDGERVKSLKPLGFLPQRTIIVDDLWRVWPYDRPNLLLCPPYLYFPEGYGEYSGFPGAPKKAKGVGVGAQGGKGSAKGGSGSGGGEKQGLPGGGKGSRRMDNISRLSYMGLKPISLILDAAATAFEASGHSPGFNVQDVIAAHRAKILKGCVVQFVASEPSRGKGMLGLRQFLPLLNLGGGRAALQLQAHTAVVRENLEELVRCYGGQCAGDTLGPRALTGAGVPLVYHRVASAGGPNGRGKFLGGAIPSIIGGSTPLLGSGEGFGDLEDCVLGGGEGEGGARGAEARLCFTDEEGGMETRSLFGESDNGSEAGSESRGEGGERGRDRGREGEGEEALRGFPAEPGVGVESPLSRSGAGAFSTIREEACEALHGISEEEAEREWDPEGGVPRANSARLRTRPRQGRGGAPRAASMHEIVVTPDMLRESPLDADSDTQQGAHSDTPQSARSDTLQAAHSDTQQSAHSDSRGAPGVRGPGASEYSDTVPPEAGAAQPQSATEVMCTAAGARDGEGFSPGTPERREAAGSALCRGNKGQCKGRVHPEGTCGIALTSSGSSGSVREGEGVEGPRGAGRERDGRQDCGVPGLHAEPLSPPEERDSVGTDAPTLSAERERASGEGLGMGSAGVVALDRQAREDSVGLQTDGTVLTEAAGADCNQDTGQAGPAALAAVPAPVTPPQLPPVRMRSRRKPSPLLPHSTGSIQLAPSAGLEGSWGKGEGAKAAYAAPGRALSPSPSPNPSLSNKPRRSPSPSPSPSLNTKRSMSPSPSLNTKRSMSPSPSLNTKRSMSPSPSNRGGPTLVPRSSSLRRQASHGAPGLHQEKGPGAGRVPRQASGTPEAPAGKVGGVGAPRESPSRARLGAFAFGSPSRGDSQVPKGPSGGLPFSLRAFSSPSRTKPFAGRDPSGSPSGPSTPRAGQGMGPFLAAFRGGMSPVHNGKRASSPSPGRHAPGTPSKTPGHAHGTPSVKRTAESSPSGRPSDANSGTKVGGGHGRSLSPSQPRGRTAPPGRLAAGAPKASRGAGDPLGGPPQNARSPSPRHRPVTPRRVLKPAPPMPSHSHSYSQTEGDARRPTQGSSESGSSQGGGVEAKAGGLPLPAVTHVVLVPTAGPALWSKRYTMGVPRGASEQKQGGSQLLSALWVIDSCTGYDQRRADYYTL